MKKRIITLLFNLLIMSNTFADVVIPCPSTPHDTLNGKPWNIYLREQNNAANNTTKQYHLYDATNNIITDDLFPGRVILLQFSYNVSDDRDRNPTARAVLEDNGTITLICTGTYVLQRKYSFYRPCENFIENYMATTSVDNSYRSCMSKSDNKSFVCW